MNTYDHQRSGRDGEDVTADDRSSPWPPNR